MNNHIPSFPTAINDINREILYRLDINSIKQACMVNKELYTLCDDFFWHSKFIRDYVDLGPHMDYKHIYNKVPSATNMTELMYFSAIEGYPVLFEFAIKNGADIYKYTNRLPLIIMNQGQCEYKAGISFNFDPAMLFDHVCHSNCEHSNEAVNIKYRHIPSYSYACNVYNNSSRRQIFDRNKENILKIFEILFSYGFKCNDNSKIIIIINMSILYNAIDIIHLLYNNGINFSYFLEAALAKNRPDVVQLIINSKFDISFYYSQIIDYIVEYDHMHMRKQLLSKVVDKQYLSHALVCAADNGDIEFVKELLENGADIHADDDDALIRAADNGHLDVVKELLACGADIHVQRELALWCALDNGRLEIVRELLDHGADIHVDNDKLLRFAKSHCDNEIIELLEMHINKKE